MADDDDVLVASAGDDDDMPVDLVVARAACARRAELGVSQCRSVGTKSSGSLAVGDDSSVPLACQRYSWWSSPMECASSLFAHETQVTGPVWTSCLGSLVLNFMAAGGSGRRACGNSCVRGARIT